MSSNIHEHDPIHPPHDELDALLRIWHDENAERAASMRADVIARLHGERDESTATQQQSSSRRGILARLSDARRVGSLRAAAAFALLITAIALLIPLNSRPAQARQEVIMLPEGGKLEARDARGQVIGPCALKHTDVHADIAGPFSRVTVKQQYHNPYSYKIEAVYTFPLSHRAAVDRMTMTIGDRIIEGEVHERQQARQMYESARQAGHVASLLEQERPNIFTQSIANIEPNADVLIEISYIEMLQQRNGEYTFDFPMVVAPRYIPGTPIGSLGNARRFGFAGALPNELERREGAILLGPATFEQQKLEILGAIGQDNLQFNKTPRGPAPFLQRIIDVAVPIMTPDGAYRSREDVQALYRANPSYDFDVLYADGTREFGQIAGDGLGHIAGRWFYFDPSILALIQREEASSAAAFAVDTNQVPDASVITPMPVRPPMRAGHDISLTVKIDTGAGGPAIIDWNSDLHEIICTDPPSYRDLGNKVNLALKNQSEIPNRDFVLRWRCIDDSIREAVFAHADAKWVDAGDGGDGGFFTAVIAPPATVAPESILPRELVFVLDTSGSMQGFPIEKAKSVMSKAIDAMRPGDTFNLITFSGDTRILWKQPRPNTEANRAEAQAMLASRTGEGGTEMMTAINAALTQAPAEAKAQALTPADLANLPADGREVIVRTRFDDIEAIVMKSAVMQPVLRVRPDLTLKTTSFQFPVEQMFGNPLVELRGKWSTINGERTLEVANAARVYEAKKELDAMRIVMFLTDGLVGNDDAIIAAVRENAKTTRVFSFGIGDSPNRYLLDGIAQAGRGEATYVNLQNDPDAAVQAFAKRIEAPVLRDIQLSFSDLPEGAKVFDVMPALDSIPDLWDVRPLIIHGRYSIDGQAAEPRTGKLTITGKTATGDYTRVIDITLPAKQESHAMLPALWARAKIDDVLARDDGMKRNGGVTQYASDDSKRQIIALGERYGVTSAFTSFVAIEKARLTIAGHPVLVPIPIELASGLDWDGFFDDANREAQARDFVRGMGVDEALRMIRQLQLELRYDEALFVIDGILQNEPSNPSAMALRELISTTLMYREYMDHQKTKNLGYSQLEVDNQASLIIPRRNLTGPGEKSVMGRLEYPADWPQLSARRQLGKINGNVATDFAGAPSLDLDEALNQGQMHYRFAPQDGSMPIIQSNYGITRGTTDLYFMQAQQQLGEIDPASIVRLGLDMDLKEVNPILDFAGGASPESETLRQSVGASQPLSDGAAFVPPAAANGNWRGAKPAQNPPAPSVGYVARGEELSNRAADLSRYAEVSSQISGGSAVSEALVKELGKIRAEAVALERRNVELDEAMRGVTSNSANDEQARRALAEELAKVKAERANALQQLETAENEVVAEEHKRIADELASSQQSRRASESARKASAQEEQARRGQQTAEGLARARTLMSEQKLDEAGQVLDEVLFIDEHNAEAKALKQQIAPAATENKAADAPVREVEKDIEIWQLRLAETHVPVEFNNNSLEQIFAFFEQVTGMDIYADWDALKTMGVDRTSQVTLKMSDDAPMSTVLERTLQLVGNADAHPVFTGREAVVIITSPTALTDGKVAAKADELNAQAKAAVAEFMAQRKRQHRLERIIDQRLWPAAFAAADDTPAWKYKTGDGAEHRAHKPTTPATPATIVVLLRDVGDKAAIEQLKSLGMRLDDTNAALSLVAGEIANARRLVDVALLESVRRIEPIVAK